MNWFKVLIIVIPLSLNAQQNLFVGNTKKNILLAEKFKYYVVPFVKSYDDSILIKTNSDWKLAFAIVLNRLLVDSLRAQSLNIKNNKHVFQNLNAPEKLKSLLHSATIFYIDTFKVSYVEKKLIMVTAMNLR